MSKFDELRYEFGDMSNLAQQLDISPQAIANWVHRNRIPIKYIKRIVELTEGRVTREMLAPEIFGE